MPWRRHLLTCPGEELLIEVRAVSHNPFFTAVTNQQLWSTVATHGAPIWVLLWDVQLGTVAMLRRLSARLSATLDQGAQFSTMPSVGATQNEMQNLLALRRCSGKSRKQAAQVRDCGSGIQRIPSYFPPLAGQLGGPSLQLPLARLATA